MNLAYYLVAFDMATDVLWPRLGLGEGFRARGLGTFAAESWQAYIREVREGDPLACDSAVLAFDGKRLLVRHRMRHAAEGWTTAENEVLFLCVDLGLRKVVPWPEEVLAAFASARVNEAPRRLSLKRG
jgi:acyl-CoA thioester hydrolase